MKYLIAAIVLSVLILKLVSLLPAEAADKRVPGRATDWQSAVARDSADIDSTQTQQSSSVSGAAQGQVVVSARVLPIRLLVIDDESNLIQIWSNGDEPARLEARKSSRNGPEVPVSPALRAAYDRVAPTIPPGAKGLVYQRP